MNFEQLKSLITALIRTDLRRLSDSQLEAALTRLMECGGVLNASMREGDSWNRGVRCSVLKGQETVRDVIYHPRPAEITTYGRANYPGEATFYGSWNISTVLAELKATVGERIYLIKARPRKDQKVNAALIGETEHAYHTGRSRIDRDLPKVLLDEMESDGANFPQVYLDSFLPDRFREKINPEVDEQNYRLTAAYAKAIWRTQRGAVMYPSVETRAAMNIAVPSRLFDKCFEVLYAEVIRITAYHGYALWDFEVEKATCEFDDDEPRWNSSKELPHSRNETLGIEVPADYAGWRPVG